MITGEIFVDTTVSPKVVFGSFTWTASPPSAASLSPSKAQTYPTLQDAYDALVESGATVIYAPPTHHNG